MFNKQIHKNDFRLRILVTDGCNKNCYHCLNDFQDKPAGKPTFLSPIIAKRIIKDYCSLVGEKAQVEFSGGEPGIYPFLAGVVSFAKKFKPFIKINTNGIALDLGIDHLVDCWHIGGLYKNVERIKEVNGQIQIVVSDVNIYSLDHLVSFYGRHDIPIKLFIDFFSSNISSIERSIRHVINRHKEFDIKTRYTGIQENRGKLCKGCNKKCITLKALWVFPDGTVSPCPQKQDREKYTNISQITEAFEGHRI